MKIYIMADDDQIFSIFYDKKTAVYQSKVHSCGIYEIDANLVGVEKEETAEEKLDKIKSSLIWYKSNPYANSFAFYDDVSNILGVKS